MRWFVEVSRVGESGLSENYCVEARQWQAALQEARKLRGDTGALSKFSIELLDDGYRAVDPSLKLRYLVNQAPGDAPLTPLDEEVDANSAKSNGKSGKHGAPAIVSPTAFATSVAPESMTKPASSVIPRPTSHAPPRPTSSVAPRPAPNAPPPRPQQLVVPHDPVPPAPPAPPARPAPTAYGTVGEVEVEVEPALLPPFEVVRERAEESRPESPITYREVAYAVPPGSSRAQVEALLWDRFKEVAAQIEARQAGKFVQLAVFDHVFQSRPERPPLATFAWKDWRGSPVLAFPGFGEAASGPVSQVPPSASQASVPPAAVDSAAPLAQPSGPAAAPTPSFPPLPTAAAPLASATAAPLAASLPAKPLLSTPSEAAPAPIAPEPVAAAGLVAAAPLPTASVAEADVSVRAAAIVADVPAPPPAVFAAAASRQSSPNAERQSRPRIGAPGRRRAGEDLIGELFEVMHELHFMRDVATGAEFVLTALNDVLPCEGVLIHVFDINTNHFVVVRAKGPNAKGVLLQRMHDQDPLALSVMRSARAVLVEDAASDPCFNGPRWAAVGVAPKTALCGAVRQGGRYLGLIELVNPAGGTPFHASEANALDYICEQFAEFLSNRPIIVAADVVLARS